MTRTQGLIWLHLLLALNLSACGFDAGDPSDTEGATVLKVDGDNDGEDDALDENASFLLYDDTAAPTQQNQPNSGFYSSLYKLFFSDAFAKKVMNPTKYSLCVVGFEVHGKLPRTLNKVVLAEKHFDHQFTEFKPSSELEFTSISVPKEAVILTTQILIDYGCPGFPHAGELETLNDKIQFEGSLDFKSRRGLWVGGGNSSFRMSPKWTDPELDGNLTKNEMKKTGPDGEDMITVESGA